MSNERFEVVDVETGHKVRDTLNGKYVAFSFSNPPLYEGEGHNAGSVWGNYYAARGFAQRLGAMQTD